VLERSLKETYGLYIYQEQVMNISRELCGFSPAEADDLRKAMGKKDLNVLKKLEEKFIDGAWKTHQFDREKCKEMWEKILGFASYCFNKSHSACYGLIAYWTAYAKANHHAAFMCANLIYEMDNKDKMTKFVEELRGVGIPVLPPDINESGWEFTMVPGRKAGQSELIRFGFGGVKGVGEAAAQHLFEQRKSGGQFESLFQLCERIDTHVVNKRVIENLIKVGAFDGLHQNRRSMSEAVERAFDRGAQIAKTREQHQETLFDSFDADTKFKQVTQGYADVVDFPIDERLSFEKQLTGYWISSHPVTVHTEEFAAFAAVTSRELPQIATGTPITIAAVILDKRVIRTKTGKMMAILTLEDAHGRFEGVLFPGNNSRRNQNEVSPYEKFGQDCNEDVVALFKGAVERRQRRAQTRRPATMDADEDSGDVVEPVNDDDGDTPANEPAEQLPSLIINDMIPVNLVCERLTKEISIVVDDQRHAKAQIDATELLFKEHAGSCPVRMLFHSQADVALTITLGDRWRVHPNRELLNELGRIWGSDCVKVDTSAEIKGLKMLAASVA
jgi:DNA polymerase III alpha subunit